MILSSDEKVLIKRKYRTIIFAFVALLANKTADTFLNATLPLFFDFASPSQESPTLNNLADDLVQWSATGFFQHLLEVVALLLAMKKRWDVLVLLLAGTNAGENCVVNWKTRCARVAGVGDIVGVKQSLKALEEFRLPVPSYLLLCVAIIHHRDGDQSRCVCDNLCDEKLLTNFCQETASHESIASETYWGGCSRCSLEQKIAAEETLISILPFLFSHIFSEDVFTYRPWHEQFLVSTPLLPEFEPEEFVNWSMEHVCQVKRLFANHPVGTDLAWWASTLPVSGVVDHLFNLYILGGSQPFTTIYNPPSEYTLPQLNSARQKALREECWAAIPTDAKLTRRFYTLLELLCRCGETQLVNDRRSPATELLECYKDSHRESQLARSRRVLGEVTGCQLSMSDVYLLRVLENWDEKFGIPTGVPGLSGTDRTFKRALNLSDFLLECLVTPFAHGIAPSGESCSYAIKLEPPSGLHSAGSWSSLQGRGHAEGTFGTSSGIPLDRTIGSDASEHESEANSLNLCLCYPTLLPDKVARFLPAWFATRGNILALKAKQDEDVTKYLGWRTLLLEVLHHSCGSCNRSLCFSKCCQCS